MLNKIRQARQGLGMEDDTNNPEAVPGADGSTVAQPVVPTKLPRR